MSTVFDQAPKTPTDYRDLPPPPLPDDQERWLESSLRYRILEGAWELDAYSYNMAQLGSTRNGVVGRANITHNTLKTLSKTISTLYDSPATIMNPDDASLLLMEAALEECGMWVGGHDLQTLTTAMNESFRLFSWRQFDPADPKSPGRISCEIYPASRVWGVPRNDDPSRFGAVYILRERMVTDPVTDKFEKQWVWDVWSILPSVSAGKASLDTGPVFRVYTHDFSHNITAQYVKPEEWTGDRYPLRDEQQRPVIPGRLYHGQHATRLWSPWRNHELVQGTLQDGTNFTNLHHGMMRASWAQRYIVGGRITGAAKTQGAEGGLPSVQHIPADPVGVTTVRSDGDFSPVVGQWGSPVDPKAHEEVYRSISTSLAVHYGISPADISIEKSNPRSGAAIRVSRSAQRTISKRVTPLYRAADLDSIKAVAAILRWQGDNVTDSGWQIAYSPLALDMDERLQLNQVLEIERRERVTSRLEHRMMLHPEETPEMAKKALEKLDKEDEPAAPIAPPTDEPDDPEDESQDETDV